MEPDAGDSITPLKTRSNQRRSTSEVHVHAQRRTPSLQDKPVPDLSPPVDQRQVSTGIAPTKSRNPSLGSPLRVGSSPRGQDVEGGFEDDSLEGMSPRKSSLDSGTQEQSPMKQ